MNTINREHLVEGGFPLSVATSIALESYIPPTQTPYDKERKIPIPKVPLSGYQSVYVNLETLCRNLQGAIDGLTLKAIPLTPADLSNLLISEVDNMSRLITTHHTTCKVIFYVSIHRKLYETPSPIYSLRLPTTERQQEYHSLINDALTIFLKDKDQVPDIIVYTQDFKPLTQGERSIIISHLPYDLLSYSSFRLLTLLETHTGNSKDRLQWYTKYYPMKTEDMSILPFNRTLLYAFGDKALFRPAQMPTRLALMGIARKSGWTATTAESKVIADIKHLGGPDLYRNMVE